MIAVSRLDGKGWTMSVPHSRRRMTSSQTAQPFGPTASVLVLVASVLVASASIMRGAYARAWCSRELRLVFCSDERNRRSVGVAVMRVAAQGLAGLSFLGR